MNSLPSYIKQPGPSEADFSLATTGAVPLDFTLPAGTNLHDGLSDHIAQLGLIGGFFHLKNIALSQADYVIPARAPDDRHVAWYSDRRNAPTPAVFQEATLHYGTHKEQPFFHCHGILETTEGAAVMGHFFPETCILAAPARLKGMGFCDARFERGADAQTGFDLFTPHQKGPTPTAPTAALLRIAPNIEFARALMDSCQNLGWQEAEVSGLGSLIGAHFTDGRVMHSFATEFLIKQGAVDLSGPTARTSIEIAIVGLEGDHMIGELAPTGNPVLITSEIILTKTA